MAHCQSIRNYFCSNQLPYCTQIFQSSNHRKRTARFHFQTTVICQNMLQAQNHENGKIESKLIFYNVDYLRKAFILQYSLMSRTLNGKYGQTRRASKIRQPKQNRNLNNRKKILNAPITSVFQPEPAHKYPNSHLKILNAQML